MVLIVCSKRKLAEVRAPLYFRLFKRFGKHALFCCVCNCLCVDMFVLCMLVDENVFTLLVQFTYDFENICMNCYVLVTYA